MENETQRNNETEGYLDLTQEAEEIDFSFGFNEAVEEARNDIASISFW